MSAEANEIIRLLDEIKSQLRRANEHRVATMDCLDALNETLKEIADRLNGKKEGDKK